MRKHIRGGHVIDPANGINEVADIYIDKGIIAAVGRKPAGFTADKTIDAKDRLVCPGLVDLSVHLREPGESYKASITSETTAAAASGITSLCCPPDTDPVIDSTAVVELINQRAQKTRKARVYPVGALTKNLSGETLAEMHALKTAGCVGVGNAWRSMNDSIVLLRALEYAATIGMTVHLSCEDGYLRDDGVVHEGVMNIRLGLAGIPETAETVAVTRALLLIEQTGARVHFCRLSCKRSIELIANAKKQGLPVTADVAITHLFLTEMDLDGFNSQCYLEPPLREQDDRKGLRRGIAAGTIDAICSNHHPHDKDAKTAPFSLTEAGASSIDVLLPLSMQLVEDKVLSLVDVIATLTINPARIAGIDAGTLGRDMPADICIIDPEENWTVTEESLKSAGKNSPFLEWEMKGRVVQTLLGGRSVYKNKAG